MRARRARTSMPTSRTDTDAPASLADAITRAIEQWSCCHCDVTVNDALEAMTEIAEALVRLKEGRRKFDG